MFKILRLINVHLISMIFAKTNLCRFQRKNIHCSFQNLLGLTIDFEEMAALMRDRATH